MPQSTIKEWEEIGVPEDWAYVPVSYTHLTSGDNYLAWLVLVLEFSFDICAECIGWKLCCWVWVDTHPVSYTQLDVYKRQRNGLPVPQSTTLLS